MLLEKNKIYTFGNYSYVNFVSLSDDELKMILEWRNHSDIRKCMNNTELIPQESHLQFCHNLKNRQDVFYWLIKKDEKPIGVLNIIDVDYKNEACEPGFYLAPEVMGRGESIFVLSNYKDFLLNGLQFKKLIGHNYVDNKPSLIFTLFFGAHITGIKEVNGRLCVQSVLERQSFINGPGTDRLMAKYAKYYKAFEMNKIIEEYGIE